MFSARSPLKAPSSPSDRPSARPTCGRWRALGSLLALLGALFAPVSSQATQISHFQAAPGPHNYVVTQHPSVLRHLTPSAWLLTTYAHDPLVCRDDDFREIHKVVEHQLEADLAGSFGLFDRFEIGGSLPLTYLYGPNFEGVNGACEGFDPAGVNNVNIKDPRLFGKVLLTPWTEGFVASVRAMAEIPMAQLHWSQWTDADKASNISDFTGDTWPTLTPAVTVGYTHKWVRAAVDVGYQLRAPSTVGTLRVGHEVTWGAAAEFTILPETVYIDVDVYGTVAPSFGEGLDFAFGNRNQFPVEAIAAVKGYIGPVSLIFGAGTGVVPDYGAPDVRVFAGVGYFPVPEVEEAPPPKPMKLVVRKKKKKKKKKKKRKKKKKKKPEPEPEPEEEILDSDGDGLLDPDDDCPDAPEDLDDFEDEDGCPDWDNDKDQILDEDDQCPNDPEDVDRWEDEDGCPDPDNDKDQILDVDDECPNDPEVVNGFEDEDGCPDAKPEEPKKVIVIVKREKIEINDKVYFAYDSDRILPRSYELLDKVAEVIVDHQEIPMVRIEGHTDSDGRASYNKKLSDRRAKSVRRYLVAAGVKSARLVAVGYGEEQPIDTNKTDEGKSNNRRVEFTILELDGEDDNDSGEDMP